MLNIWGDHQTADHITNRVPLIVRWPGVTDSQAGNVRSALHYHLDLPATLVALLGRTQPDAWDGASFADDLTAPTEHGRDYLVLSQGAWSCQRSVRWDRWLLIRTYHTGLKAFPAYMLFDLDADPHETTNLVDARPDVLGEGLRKLDEWMGEQMHRSQRGDPFWGVIAEGGLLHARVGSREWDAYLTRLRTSGRSHHADTLAAHVGRPLKHT